MALRHLASRENQGVRLANLYKFSYKFVFSFEKKDSGRLVKAQTLEFSGGP